MVTHTIFWVVKKGFEPSAMRKTRETGQLRSHRAKSAKGQSRTIPIWDQLYHMFLHESCDIKIYSFERNYISPMVLIVSYHDWINHSEFFEPIISVKNGSLKIIVALIGWQSHLFASNQNVELLLNCTFEIKYSYSLLGVIFTLFVLTTDVLSQNSVLVRQIDINSFMEIFKANFHFPEKSVFF